MMSEDNDKELVLTSFRWSRKLKRKYKTKMAEKGDDQAEVIRELIKKHYLDE